MGEGPTIDELVVADAPEAWEALGFAVEDAACDVGSVRIGLAGPDAGRGLVRWSIRGLESTDLDGVATVASESAPRPVAGEHPNGVVALDHVVAMSPDLDRTIAAAEAAGLELRRLREGPTPGGAMRQGFFRMAEVVLEVIEQPPPHADPSKPARLWGLAFVASDLERLASGLGDRISPVREAIQPGRRIASLRRSAGIAVPVAFMSP